MEDWPELFAKLRAEIASYLRQRADEHASPAVAAELYAVAAAVEAGVRA